MAGGIGFVLGMIVVAWVSARFDAKQAAKDKADREDLERQRDAAKEQAEEQRRIAVSLSGTVELLQLQLRQAPNNTLAAKLQAVTAERDQLEQRLGNAIRTMERKKGKSQRKRVQEADAEVARRIEIARAEGKIISPEQEKQIRQQARKKAEGQQISGAQAPKRPQQR